MIRLCGGFGRAFVPLGALVLALVVALAVSGCLRQAAEPDALGGVAASASEPTARAGDFAVQAGDVVYFGGDSAELTADAKATLQKQIDWLNRHPDIQVVVEGHADEWGTLQHNLSLGAKRAVAVKSYLRRHGLRARKIHTVSYGKERLVADCSALTCRSKNRRAQTVISAPSG